MQSRAGVTKTRATRIKSVKVRADFRLSPFLIFFFFFWQCKPHIPQRLKHMLNVNSANRTTAPGKPGLLLHHTLCGMESQRQRFLGQPRGSLATPSFCRAGSWIETSLSDRCKWARGRGKAEKVFLWAAVCLPQAFPPAQLLYEPGVLCPSRAGEQTRQTTGKSDQGREERSTLMCFQAWYTRRAQAFHKYKPLPEGHNASPPAFRALVVLREKELDLDVPDG